MFDAAASLTPTPPCVSFAMLHTLHLASHMQHNLLLMIEPSFSCPFQVHVLVCLGTQGTSQLVCEAGTDLSASLKPVLMLLLDYCLAGLHVF